MHYQLRKGRGVLLLAGLAVTAILVAAIMVPPMLQRASRPPLTAEPSATRVPTATPLGARARLATLQAPRGATPETSRNPAGGGPSAVPRAAINIRSGPGTSYPVIGSAGTEARLTIVGRDATGEWWQVLYSPTGAGCGWVNAGVVEVRGETIAVPVVP
jgi:hypothetical protein